MKTVRETESHKLHLGPLLIPYQIHKLTILFFTLVSHTLALAPIDVQGANFIDTSTGNRFVIVGVDYQPGGSSGYGTSGFDPLSNATVCLRDAVLMQDLGVRPAILRRHPNSPSDSTSRSTPSARTTLTRPSTTTPASASLTPPASTSSSTSTAHWPGSRSTAAIPRARTRPAISVTSSASSRRSSLTTTPWASSPGMRSSMMSPRRRRIRLIFEPFSVI